MRSYLQQYEPVIHQSITAAAKTPTRSLLTFPGFRASSRPQQGPAPSNGKNPNRSRPSSGIGKTTLPHKHTRWKQVSTVFRNIRTYFQPTTPK
jgi:hypothetical protein